MPQLRVLDQLVNGHFELADLSDVLVPQSDALLGDAGHHVEAAVYYRFQGRIAADQLGPHKAVVGGLSVHPDFLIVWNLLRGAALYGVVKSSPLCVRQADVPVGRVLGLRRRVDLASLGQRGWQVRVPEPRVRLEVPLVAAAAPSEHEADSV